MPVDMPVDMAAAYAAGRERVGARASDASDAELQTEVPACPLWTVRDVVGHLTGVAADTLADNFPKGNFEGWTQAQVDSRRERPLPDVLAEWAELSPKIEARITEGGGRMNFLVADVVSHDFDVASALGQDADRDAPEVLALADMFVAGLGARLTGAELAPVDLRAADGVGGPWRAGEGDDAIAVTAPSAFEILRAMSGRRCSDQITAWDWSADPTPYLDVLSIFAIRATPLHE